MSFLQIEGLGRRFGSVRALDGVSLALAAGSRTAVVGPSGSGKTTLLRLVAGFDVPDAGRILLDGQVLAEPGGGMPAHRRGIGFVPQDGALFPHLSIAENVGFGLDRHLPDRGERIGRLMDMVELDRSLLSRRPHQLSGGQQQRVALARALARQPRLMLLDEPFSALDAGLRDNMRRAVARILGEAGITAMLVTHDQAEALSFADQVAVLMEGRLVQAGTPRRLYRAPSDRATAAFLGEAVFLPAEIRDGWADSPLGRIQTDAEGFTGQAEIMLRPDQLRFEQPVELSGAGLGRVVDVQFGAICAVEIVPEGTAANGRIVLRAPEIEVPPIGSLVRLAVFGRAHAFVGGS